MFNEITSKDSVPNVWEDTFSTADTTFQTAKLTFDLDKAAYEPLPDHLIKKLGSKVNDDIKDLGI